MRQRTSDSWGRFVRWTTDLDQRAFPPANAEPSGPARWLYVALVAAAIVLSKVAPLAVIAPCVIVVCRMLWRVFRPNRDPWTPQHRDEWQIEADSIPAAQATSERPGQHL